MKAIERNLYLRNGYFYFRSRIPRNLRPVIGFNELVVALKTQDLSEARIQSVQLGYELSKSLKSFQDSLKALSPEQSPELAIDALTARINDLKGSSTHQASEQILGTYKKGKPVQKLLFSHVVTKYLEDCPADAYSTREHKESTYELFKEVIGDLPFKQIGIAEGRLFKTRLLKMPPNAKRLWNVKSFENIDWDKLVTEKPQNPRTINNRLSYMGVLFSWAIKIGYYHSANPFKGLFISKSQKIVSSRCHPFKHEELQSLFRCSIYTGSKGEIWRQRLIEGETVFKDNLYWVPLIGLYSGMRLNEICQLYVTDIQQEDGVYILDVNDDGEDKALKTSSSRRRVPIHKELIRRGFLDYAQGKRNTGELRLFPDIPRGASSKNYSSVFTRRFWRLLLALEIKKQGLCFHSLRHTFIDGMRNAGVERSIVMTMTGHQSSKGVHDSYGYGYNLSILTEGINKLSFPALEN